MENQCLSKLLTANSSFLFRKLFPRLGGPEYLSFYQEPLKQNFDFCYINCNKNYMINYVNHLFQNKTAIMFSAKEKYLIHKNNKSCDTSHSTSANKESTEHHDVIDFVKSLYPKQKFLPLVFQSLSSLIDKNMFFINFPNVHVADFCTFINNKFGKVESTDLRFIKLCKFLQNQNIKCAKISIKNPVAQKYLC